MAEEVLAGADLAVGAEAVGEVCVVFSFATACGTIIGIAINWSPYGKLARSLAQTCLTVTNLRRQFMSPRMSLNRTQRIYRFF